MSDRLCGIWGQPYLDLAPFVDTSAFAELDDEITYGLARVHCWHTGGSLKWMGVVAPWVHDDGFRDYGEVIAGFDRRELERFIALGEPEWEVDLDRPEQCVFGDETERPLNWEQIQYLKFRHGVYFPWKVCYHLLENRRWDDKDRGADKDFTDEAKEIFPRTVAFVRSLPFVEVGRVVVFGIESNDHAPAHRDSEPGRALGIAHCINFDPRGDKRFYLVDPENRARTVVDSRIYWFNDMDYHGVEAAPSFRYSLRIDGVFEPEFLRRLRKHHGA